MKITDPRKLITRNDYGKISKIYTDDFGNDHNHFSFVDKIIASLKEMNLNDNPVVDLGAGSGVISDYLLEKNISNITAIDLTPEFCKIMESKYENKVRVICDDMLPYIKSLKNSSISAYIANYSIIHIPDEEVEELFSEINRTLVKKGLFLMSCHKGKFKGTEPEPYQLQNDTRLSKQEPLEVYLNYFTEEELENRIKKSGFNIIYLETFETEPISGEIPVPKIWLIAQK